MSRLSFQACPLEHSGLWDFFLDGFLSFRKHSLQTNVYRPLYLRQILPSSFLTRRGESRRSFINLENPIFFLKYLSQSIFSTLLCGFGQRAFSLHSSPFRKCSHRSSGSSDGTYPCGHERIGMSFLEGSDLS